jgi:hypothetical protein
MFTGMDACAVTAGLLMGPRQNESSLIVSLKEFVYSRLNIAEEKSLNGNSLFSPYLEFAIEPLAFAADMASYRSMNGDYKDKAWGMGLLSRWQRNVMNGQAAVVLTGSTVCILRLFLSEVLTQEENKIAEGLGKIVESKNPPQWKTPGSCPRDQFWTLNLGCDDYPQEFDVMTHGEDVDMYYFPMNKIYRLLSVSQTIQVDQLCMVNHPHYFSTIAGNLICSTLALNSAQKGAGKKDFSLGIAKVMREFNISSKGAFKVTVPSVSSEFPLIHYDDAPPIKCKPHKRVNPVFVSKRNRSAMGKRGYKSLTKIHTEKYLTLNPEMDNEDICNFNHYKCTRLYRMLSRDGAKGLTLAQELFDGLLSVRAQQKNNDRLVEEYNTRPE